LRWLAADAGTRIATLTPDIMDDKAFVSSTIVDLQPHRKAVIGALRDGGSFVDPRGDARKSGVRVRAPPVVRAG
jgi:hypothetical protein